MTDLYLRADDEVALDLALAAVRAGEPMAAIDRIGMITRDREMVDGAPDVETLPGWHANVRMPGEPSAALLADLDGLLIPEPVSPFRLWM